LHPQYSHIFFNAQSIPKNSSASVSLATQFLQSVQHPNPKKIPVEINPCEWIFLLAPYSRKSPTNNPLKLASI
jgi:hypothetical protein